MVSWGGFALILKLGSSTPSFTAAPPRNSTMPGTLLPENRITSRATTASRHILLATTGSGTMPNADVTDVSVNCTPISSCENLDVDGDGQLLPADGLIFSAPHSVLMDNESGRGSVLPAALATRANNSLLL